MFNLAKPVKPYLSMHKVNNVPCLCIKLIMKFTEGYIVAAFGCCGQSKQKRGRHNCAYSILFIK